MSLPAPVEELLTALGRQRDLYRKLFAQAVRQRDALQAGDTATLVAIVEEKQRLLAVGEEVDRLLAPWRERWAAARGELAAADRARVDDVVGQVEEVLRALLALEQECTRLVEAGLAATGEEIERMTQARRVQSAYRPPAEPNEARFLDRKE